jgi:hypothetical protein
MLTATKAAVILGGVPSREQRIVEAGRRVSAGFVALAAVALSLLALAWRGWAAAVATGLAVLLHHQFFELAHYLKEDTALVFGIALTFLAAFLFAQKPTVLWAGALGIAVACAISGKYIGVVALVVVPPVLWRTPAEGRTFRLVVFASALVVALLAINLPLILQPAVFAHSFHREVGLVVHGQEDTARRVPHAQYLNIFRDNTTPVMWVLLIVFLAERWRERRTLKLVEWLLIAFPFAYTLALSFSPKTNDRYFLPAAAMFTLFAAIGALDVAQLLRSWVPARWSSASMIVLLLAAQVVTTPPPASWKTLTEYFEAFQHDDNRELFDWVKTELPPEAVIAKDSRILLPDPENPKDAGRFDPLPQRIIARRYAADLGTFNEMRTRGITHIAISETDYGGFFRDGARPKKNEAADFERRKAFYTALLRFVPLFQRDRGTVLYLHPGIRLYAVPPEE